MTTHATSLLLTSVLLAVAAATFPPRLALARDDVPPELQDKSNPIALDKRQVRYFTRQYKGKCARCHGRDGNGTGKEGSDQEFPPANFTDADYMNSRSDGQLFYQIKMGGGERCAMPAFGPDSDHGWSEEKIWQMVSFVRRFSGHFDP